jgi:hypothetical protein
MKSEIKAVQEKATIALSSFSVSKTVFVSDNLIDQGMQGSRYFLLLLIEANELGVCYVCT